MSLFERFLLFGGGPTAIILLMIPILLVIAEWRDRHAKSNKTPRSDTSSERSPAAPTSIADLTDQ